MLRADGTTAPEGFCGGAGERREQPRNRVGSVWSQLTLWPGNSSFWKRRQRPLPTHLVGWSLRLSPSLLELDLGAAKQRHRRGAGLALEIRLIAGIGLERHRPIQEVCDIPKLEIAFGGAAGAQALGHNQRRQVARG